MSLYWFTNSPDNGVRRYRVQADWTRNIVAEIQARQVDVVLDVGANVGQYATSLREADFKGRIVSFEPLSAPFSVLERAASTDPLWECRRCALGDIDGTAVMNVAGNGGGSSSVLQMLKAHREAFPQANYIGTEGVTMRRLESVAAEILRPDDVGFLKIDVQGFEKQVLSGGASTVSDRCVGVQIELSFVPLYDGGMLAQEALDLVQALGFTLRGFAPFFVDVRTGEVLQADGVFFRADAG